MSGFFLGGLAEGQKQLRDEKFRDTQAAQTQSNFERGFGLEEQQQQQSEIQDIVAQQEKNITDTQSLIQGAADRSKVGGIVKQAALAHAKFQIMADRLTGGDPGEEEVAHYMREFITKISAVQTQGEAFASGTQQGIEREQAERAAFGTEWSPVYDESKNIIGQRNAETGELKAAPEGMTPQEDSSPFETAFTEKLAEKAAGEIAEERSDAATMVKDRRDSIGTIEKGMNLLEGGAITGFGADFRLGMQKALQLSGLPVSEDAIANTEAYKALMGKEVGKTIKLFGSGTGLSDADREYAQGIVGGNISASPQSLNKILEINRIANLLAIDDYNEDIEKFTDEIKGSGRVYKKVALSEQETKEIADYRDAYEAERKAKKSGSAGTKTRTTASGITYTVE